MNNKKLTDDTDYNNDLKATLDAINEQRKVEKRRRKS